MVKILVKIGIGVLVVIILAVVIAFWQINAIAKQAVQRGGTYALGVDTTVRGIDISLFGGTVVVTDLNIANPKGFDAPHLMHNGRFALAVESGSLMGGDTIVVPAIELDGLDVYYQKTGDTDNVQPILDNLEKIKGKSDETGEEETPAEEPEEGGTKFIIKKLIITNVTVHLDVPVIGKHTVKVPKIELNDLTQDNAQGLAMNEVFARVIPAVLASVFSVKGVTELVPNVAGALVEQIGKVDDVALAIGSKAGEVATAVIDEGMKAVGEIGSKAGEAVGEGAEKAGEAVKDIGEGAGKAAEDIGKGIGDGIKNIFGGDKDE